jgi:hypothetical protein
MNITISPLAATEVEAVVENRGVRYPSLRLDVWVALTALSDPGHQAMHWGKDLAGGDDFDSLAEHLACLYDECEILPRPERAVGSILRASEVPAMRMLGRQLGALILELGEAPDSCYLTDPRWFDVVVAAEGALAAMES